MIYLKGRMQKTRIEKSSFFNEKSVRLAIKHSHRITWKGRKVKPVWYRALSTVWEKSRKLHNQVARFSEISDLHPTPLKKCSIKCLLCNDSVDPFPTNVISVIYGGSTIHHEWNKPPSTFKQGLIIQQFVIDGLQFADDFLICHKLTNYM